MDKQEVLRLSELGVEVKVVKERRKKSNLGEQGGE